MSHVLNREKREQVIALAGWAGRCGASNRLPECAGKRRETIYGARGLRYGVPAAGDARSFKSGHRPDHRLVITGILTAKPGCGPASNCESYRELIALELERGRNAMGIWQDLVDRHGFAGGYQSVRRFVRNMHGAATPEARAIIETRPGEECQVDYGTGPMVRDPDSGKYRRTRLFVLTLGCSRKCVRLLAFRSSARVWAELHENAFRRLGSSPRVVVLDNLRESVLSPDFCDPGLNP